MTGTASQAHEQKSATGHDSDTGMLLDQVANLIPILFHKIRTETGNGQQLIAAPRTVADDTPENLIIKDTERGNAATSCFVKSPPSERLFEA